ncbi:hypothetical protein [Haloarcula nitratireducens]|uniref:Uncharacterized protein n=1 Tax=Haloarcula nitratireducens TaxID=2487749 RepID=A0AAW4PGH5_9EURY|nr:hypothetical protein [Halomicroarcula nitratireducens]MBX0296337.1 hypothetical protein [Halomicroarcula nitratireducens]
MKTLQNRLLGSHVLALFALLLGDLFGSALLTTAGFAAAGLTLAALFVAMSSALLAGVEHRPSAPLLSPRSGK